MRKKLAADKMPGWKPMPAPAAEPAQKPMVYNEKSHKGGLCHHGSHSCKHGGLVHSKEKSSNSQNDDKDSDT